MINRNETNPVVMREMRKMRKNWWRLWKRTNGIKKASESDSGEGGKKRTLRHYLWQSQHVYYLIHKKDRYIFIKSMPRDFVLWYPNLVFVLHSPGIWSNEQR